MPGPVPVHVVREEVRDVAGGVLEAEPVSGASGRRDIRNLLFVLLRVVGRAECFSG